ncbi:Hsp70 family protein [Nocardia pseudobrasiliensis]|uniref:Hsp70 protein n=1 Tax=Nocardia pseudobrasiliensis TaxID=45979 RepID=A0A370IFE0_9NOCA|nr:Hsp70 family protein [Nocardia pseudobrasiliensis]RDI68861.1 Hsp70 protein [Nocardia pseudobrasiliensis]
MITPNRGRGESENVGIGVGIGAVTTVHATVSESGPPEVTTRPTSVTVDPEFSAVTDFADLARHPETVTLGGRIYSPATLIAESVRELVPAGADAVCTHPACYDDKQVAQLRQALDLSGARQVRLLAEPLAALTWLAHEHGPLAPGYVLVYDLGATSLDVTLVEITAEGERRIAGTPIRSYDFGGRPLGAMIVRYVGDVLGPGRRLPVSLADSDELRAWHVRDSLAVLWDCLHAAELGIGDISRILLVGGASRAPEVARALAELGPEVVVSADPGHCVALGAARTALRPSARALPLSVVRAGPSMVSAVAALSVLGLASAALLTPTPGSGEMWRQTPVLDGPPGASALHDPGASGQERTVTPEAVLSAAVGEAISTVPALANPLPDKASPPPAAPALPADAPTGGAYADPSRFENPLPFEPQIDPNIRFDHTQNFGPSTNFAGTTTNPGSHNPPSTGGSTPPAGQGGSTDPGTGTGPTTSGSVSAGGEVTGEVSAPGSDTRAVSGGGTATAGGSTTGDHTSGGTGGSASVHGTVGGSTGGTTSGSVGGSLGGGLGGGGHLGGFGH